MKDQRLVVLLLLVHHLGLDNYVYYTYTAITINWLLLIKKSQLLL